MKVTAFKTLEKAWELVSEKSSFYAFQSFEWLSCWLETIGKQRGFIPYFIVVSDDQDVPFILFLVGVENRRGMKCLVFPDCIVTDYNAPIIFHGEFESYNRLKFKNLWNIVLQSLPPVDLIKLKQMPDKIHGYPNPFMGLPGLYVSNTTYSTRLEGDWETFFQRKVSSKSRNTIRRKIKKLKTMGRLTFEVINDGRLVDLVMNRLLEQKSSRMEETGATNFLNNPAYRAFYRQLAQKHTAGGPAHLSVLKLDEKILAVHLGLIHQGRFYYLVPSFEAGEWERYSTGQLLLIHLMEYCFDHQLSVMDFTLGDETYKMQWADPDLILYDYVQGISPKGKLYAGLRRYGLKMKQEAKQMFPTAYFALKRKIIRG